MKALKPSYIPALGMSKIIVMSSFECRGVNMGFRIAEMMGCESWL